MYSKSMALKSILLCGGFLSLGKACTTDNFGFTEGFLGTGGPVVLKEFQ